MATQKDVKQKTIVLSGGGTGGHITPILAVAHALKQKDPSIKTVYIGERNGKFRELTESHEAIDESYEVWAGKFRRYNGESWLKRLLDVKTNVLNIRDVVYFGMGTLQSYFLLRKIKPDRVFLKGGFVGVPVGLSAVAHSVPFITHDSDAIPGLANRIVSKWAKVHAVASDVALYPYPIQKTVQVGVLVEPSFDFVDANIQQTFKEQVGVPTSATLLLVTGGSSGAANINAAIKAIADTLLSEYADLYIVHQAGKNKAAIYGEYTHERLQVLEFMRPMYAYTGAADIVVSRASGNTIAELGTQARAVIVVPNPLLAAGHQIKNAEALERKNAALVVREDSNGTDQEQLLSEIKTLMDDPRKRQELGVALHEITLTNAADKLADLLLQ